MALHKVLKALADPARLRIINLLLEQPFCVCEMEAVLQLPQSLLSRHLAYLRAAGLVLDKRLGPRVQYSLSTAQPAFDLLRSCLRQALLLEKVYEDDLRRCHELRAGCCALPGIGPAPVSEMPKEVRRDENQGLDV